MNPLEKPKNFYICDPNKNVQCSGRFQLHCGKQCFCTTNPLYSNNPNHQLTQEEYYKEQGIRKQRIFQRIAKLVHTESHTLLRMKMDLRLLRF